MEEQGLKKDDLVLMMESYRNMITLHQTILGQQQRIVEKQDQTLLLLNDIIKTVGSMVITMTTTMDDVKSKSTEARNSQIQHALNSTKEHGTIRNRIYVALAGSGVIILTLIGLIIQIVGKQ